MRDLRDSRDRSRDLTHIASDRGTAVASATSWVDAAVRYALLCAPSPYAVDPQALAPLVAGDDDTITVRLIDSSSLALLERTLPLPLEVPLDELPGAVKRFIERIVALIEWGEGS